MRLAAWSDAQRADRRRGVGCRIVALLAFIRSLDGVTRYVRVVFILDVYLYASLPNTTAAWALSLAPVYRSLAHGLAERYNLTTALER